MVTNAPMDELFLGFRSSFGNGLDEARPGLGNGGHGIRTKSLKDAHRMLGGLSWMGGMNPTATRCDNFVSSSEAEIAPT